MAESDELTLLSMVKNSMLPEQAGIKMRAFFAFNRGNSLVTPENLELLKGKGLIEIKDDTIYPLELL